MNMASARVLKNYSFLASSYVASRLLTFLSLVYIARRLGVEAFGQVSFAYAIFVYSTLLTHLGLTTFGTREVARDPNRIQLQVSRILSLRMTLTLASFVLVSVFAYLVPLGPQVRILIVLFAVSLFPTAALMDWPFKGVERMNLVGIIEVVRAIPYLALVAFWVRTPSHVWRVPIFFLLSTILAATLGLALFRRDYGFLQPQIELDFWKRAMREALPLGFGFLLLQVYYLTDSVVLGFLRGDAFVGWYSAAYRIVSFILVAGGLFFESTFPVISRYYQGAREKLPQLLNTSVRLTALLVIPMAVGGTALARPMLTSVYGAQYGSAAIAFQFLICAVAVELMGMNWGYALMACDRAKQYMKAMALGAAMSVTLNLVLIPKLGLAGAGIARLTSSVIISAYLWLQFRRISHVNWSRYLLKPAAASGLMAMLLVFFGHSWILQMTAGLVVYGGAVLLMGSWERTQVMRIGKALLTPRWSACVPPATPTKGNFQIPKDVRPTEIVET